MQLLDSALLEQDGTGKRVPKPYPELPSVSAGVKHPLQPVFQGSENEPEENKPLQTILCLLGPLLRPECRLLSLKGELLPYEGHQMG